MEKFYNVLINLMPKKLIYLTAIRLMAHATMGKYGKTEVPGLTITEALKRYGDDFKL